MNKIQLRFQTSQQWVDAVLADFDAFDQLYNWHVHMKKSSGNSDKVLNDKLEKVTDKYAKDLLSKMLKRNPKKRIQTMAEVLNHEFFTLAVSYEDIQQHLSDLKQGQQQLVAGQAGIKQDTKLILANQAQFMKVLEEVHRGIENLPDLLIDISLCPMSVLSGTTLSHNNSALSHHSHAI